MRGASSLRRSLGFSAAELVCGAAPLTHLSGQPPGLPVGFGLIHSLADFLHQLVQFHCGLDQNRAELLPRVLMLGEKKDESSVNLAEKMRESSEKTQRQRSDPGISKHQKTIKALI